MLARPFAFLTKLKSNNNREWFQDNKKEYEAAKKDFAQFVQLLINKIADFDASLAATTPKESIFRINRDVRFSKDKSPYKTNFGAYMAEGGKKSGNACYYFHLEPGGLSFAAGGLYMPPNDDLNKIRQEIDYNQEEFKAILDDAQFVKIFTSITGDKLKRAPKGYTEDHPLVDFLKYKSYIATYKLSDETFKSDKVLDEVIPVYQSIKPMNDFLRRATVTV